MAASPISTTVSFPVKSGTEVTVGCDTGRTLSGDGVITCNQREEYTFSVKPACTIGKWDKIEKF